MVVNESGIPLQRRQATKFRWQSVTESVELGMTLFLTGLVGGVVGLQDLVMRGGVQDAPEFIYPDWGIYVLTSSASQQGLASMTFLGLSMIGYRITVRGTKARKWNFVWVGFSLGVLVPLWACWVPYINTTELTSLTWPQWFAVCLSCSLAQLVFGWHAWLLRSYSTREAIDGTRSGLTFLLVTVSIQSVLILLRYLDRDWQSAINGELWALLGSAQLLVAFTAGVGERKSVERESRVQALLNEVHRKPTQEARRRPHPSVRRASRMPIGASRARSFRRREAKRMASESDRSDLLDSRFAP